MGGNQNLYSGTFFSRDTKKGPRNSPLPLLPLIRNPRVSFIRLYVPPQNQAAENEKEIREEFDKLRKFLLEEERHRLKVLRQEEEVKKQVMSEKLKTLTEEIQNLSANVGDIEMALKEKDLPFLMVLLVLLLTAPLLT